MANIRFQTNGVDVLIDAIVTANEDPGDIRDRVWAVAWARGYQDVMIPLPTPETKIEGHVVLARGYDSGRAVVLIDDGERLVGTYEHYDIPPLGARVRLVPMYGHQTNQWSLRVLAALGCGLLIRFDESERRATDVGWVDRLRTCLANVREHEQRVRKQIEQQRRTLTFVTAPSSFRSEMERADKELREAVLAGGYTPEESKALQKAKSPEATQKIIAARNKRLVDAYRMEVVRFREQIPALRVEWDAKVEAYTAFRNGIDHLNDTDAASRSITETSQRVSASLDAIEAAALNVRVMDLNAVEADPRGRFHEIVSTIDLLFELVPKHMQRVNAAAS